VDNYDFTLNDQKKFKKLFPHIKLSCFDDEYKEYHCDEIINHNLGININKYKNPKNIKIIPPLIRDEFYKEKKKRYKKEGIFISIGGSDSKNLTIKILKILKDIKINLYTTTANKNINKIKRFVKNKRYKKNIKFYINADISKGMAKSKCGIITPSTIAYEALFMKLPFIAIQVAKNQTNLVKYLKSKRYDILTQRNLDGRKIKKSIRKLTRNTNRRYNRQS